jgi:hypothetical protein
LEYISFPGSLYNPGKTVVAINATRSNNKSQNAFPVLKPNDQKKLCDIIRLLNEISGFLGGSDIKSFCEIIFADGENGHFIFADGENGHFIFADGENGHFIFADGENGHFIFADGENGHFIFADGENGTDMMESN